MNARFASKAYGPRLDAPTRARVESVLRTMHTRRSGGVIASALALATAVTAATLTGCSSDDAEAKAPAVVAGVDPFCSTRPKLTFCEDFDDAPLPGSFETQAASGGSLTVDSETSASAPHALLAVAGSGATAHAGLEKKFAAGTKFRVFLQMHVDGPPKASGNPRTSWTEMGALDFSTAGAPYRVGFAMGADGSWWAFEKRGDGEATRFAASLPLPWSEWTSVRLDVDFVEGGAGKLTLRFGDDAVVSGVALTPPSAAAAPTLALGLTSFASDASGSGAEWRARFDNITFQVD